MLAAGRNSHMSQLCAEDTKSSLSGTSDYIKLIVWYGSYLIHQPGFPKSDPEFLQIFGWNSAELKAWFILSCPCFSPE